MARENFINREGQPYRYAAAVPKNTIVVKSEKRKLKISGVLTFWPERI